MKCSFCNKESVGRTAPPEEKEACAAHMTNLALGFYGLSQGMTLENAQRFADRVMQLGLIEMIGDPKNRVKVLKIFEAVDKETAKID